MKILVVGGAVHYASWINRDITFLDSELENVKDADLILFTGGADVHPSIYGWEKNSKTYTDKARDEYETEFYNEAIKYKKSIIGICRGAQLLTAMQKAGILIQHVENHAIAGMHPIEFEDGTSALATSTHHQMMYPFSTGHRMIAWSAKRSPVYEFDNNNILESLPRKIEPEIVFYQKTNCLAIQPHPEQMDKSSMLVVKLNLLLEELFDL